VPIMHLHPIVQDSDRSRHEIELMDSRACLTLAITCPQKAVGEDPQRAQ
jgi:hypothetical protein